MPKDNFQDAQPNKRSIRDISVPSRRAQTVDVVSRTPETNSKINTNKNPEVEKPLNPISGAPLKYDFDYDNDRPRKEKRWGLWALVLVFILALGFGVVSLFAHATVLVTPKSQTVPMQATFSASLNQPTGMFGYQIVSVSSSVQKEVPAGSQTQMNIKATGNITIFNTSNKIQNLVATTRFQASSGLIYRLPKAVSVPKATVANGKTTPGSVSVSVVADQPGDSYNIGLSDFTLPGLKGTTQYANVYARSTSPMTGGFSGMAKAVDPATLASSTADLQNKLKADLQNQITSQIPSNFILYPQSVSYTFDPVSQKSDATSSEALLTEQGNASAVIFDKALLSEAILSNLASTTLSAGLPVDNGQAKIQNLSALTFTLLQPASLTANYAGNISFSLSGDTQVVWLFDANALKNDFLGLKKSNVTPLLQAKYPTISSATVKIFPVWNQSFPSNPAKITITTVQ